MIFVQLCSSWQAFNWLKASRGPSAIAKLLVSYPGAFSWSVFGRFQEFLYLLWDMGSKQQRSTPKSAWHTLYRTRLMTECFWMETANDWVGTLVCFARYIGYSENFISLSTLTPRSTACSTGSILWSFIVMVALCNRADDYMFILFIIFSCCGLFMVALCNRADHIFSSCDFFLLFFLA